jgi:hypothetical protein
MRMKSHPQYFISKPRRSSRGITIGIDLGDIWSHYCTLNVVITAAANKLVRIAWAVLSSGQEYRPTVSPMAA